METTGDAQASTRASELEVEKNLQKGDDDVPMVAGEEESTEYVIDKIVDHGYRDGKLILKVVWYGYEK